MTDAIARHAAESELFVAGELAAALRERGFKIVDKEKCSSADELLSGLLYDVIEPLRPIVGRKVFEFVQTHRFHPPDLTIRSDRVCRLNPQMAKLVVTLVGNSEPR
jgi:hypothetical protein